MPNGEANLTGNVFEMLHADRHSAGHYRCTADNRVGTADTRDVFVNVLCEYFVCCVAKDIKCLPLKDIIFGII